MARILIEITSDVPGVETAVRRALHGLGEDMLPSLQAGEGERVEIVAQADDDGVMRTIYADDITV